MKDLIIFGRSPFINKVPLEKINYDLFDVCCINYPIPNIKVHYVVSADDTVKPILAPKTEWVSKHTGWNIIKTEKIIQEIGTLSWRIYSSSLAVNFAILRGYKNIYLCGVDLIEDDKPFTHYDGILNKRPARASGCREEKEYIIELGKKFGVNLYQMNPACTWLDFKYDKCFI